MILDGLVRLLGRPRRVVEAGEWLGYNARIPYNDPVVPYRGISVRRYRRLSKAPSP